MKRILVALLSLGLIMAFAMPAAAVDVKFSGSYYAQGWYVDNPSALDKNEAAGAASWANNSRRGPNAWYGQRLRITSEFQVVEGLKLITQFDALEKRWGDQSWNGFSDSQSRPQTPAGTPGNNSDSAKVGAATVKAQENIEWERAYLDFNIPFGKFQVGYMQYLTWGTSFLDTTLTAPGIRYFYSQGPMQVVAAVEKRAEYVGLNAANIGIANDADRDVYDLGLTYKFAPGQAGILYQYLRSSQNKWQQANGYLTQINGFYPYAQLTFGNLYLEGEAMYGFGDLRSYQSTSAAPTGGTANTNQPGGTSANNPAQNVGLSSYAAYIHGRYDFKPAYVGAKFVYVSGDDNANSDKASGSIMQYLQMNRGFYPTLILWNDDYQNNVGNIQGNIPTGATGANRRTGQSYALRQEMDNVWFYQIYAGIKPMPKMDLKASFSIASADKAPKSDVGQTGQPGYYDNTKNVQEFVSTKYGKELDLTASYKIYDNLTYMIGAGYLWVGDYFKGYDNNAVIKDNYLLTHKLTLNF